MGSVELDIHQQQLFIFSNIITYGNAATPEITELIREEIETMWNEPAAGLKLHHSVFTIVFRIQASHDPAISPIDIFQFIALYIINT
jgi:hypothetical protein